MILSRPNKYRNKPEIVDGLRFASRKEAARYRELKMRLRAGDISHLKFQVTYPLVVNGFFVCNYIADFYYLDKDCNAIVEDVKGMLTPVYRLKAKLMRACHGITIHEVGRKPRRARRKKLLPAAADAGGMA